MTALKLSDVSEKLTAQSINEAYKSRTGDQGSAQSIRITRATASGEGLLSVIYRIEVVGDYERTSFIIKTMVKDEILKRTLRSAVVFQREVQFFETVLPTLSEFQKSTGASSRIQDIVPVCYSCYCDDQNAYVLMEDLGASVGKSEILIGTKEYHDRILSTLAHFHSVSIALKYKKPQLFKSVADELFETYFVEDNRSWYKKYLQRAIDINEKAIAEYLDETNIYYNKFKATTGGDVYGEMINLVSKYRSEHPAIVHGDAWNSNFYVTEDRTTAMDFQLVREGSPALDLTFYIIVSKSDTINKNEFYEAIDVYYNSLKYYMQDMGLDVEEVYPRVYLDAEIIKYGKFGYLCSLTTIPLLSTTSFSDVLGSYAERYGDVDRIPLDDLWQLKPLHGSNKMRVINALKVAVDVGLI